MPSEVKSRVSFAPSAYIIMSFVDTNATMHYENNENNFIMKIMKMVSTAPVGLWHTKGLIWTEGQTALPLCLS